MFISAFVAIISSHFSRLIPITGHYATRENPNYGSEWKTSTTDALLHMNISSPLGCCLQSIKVLKVLYKRILIPMLRHGLN